MSLPHHLNLKQVRNLQYHIYAYYYIHVLYRKILHTLKNALNMRHQVQKVFSVSSLKIHSIKRVSCVHTKYKEDNIFISCRFLWKFFYCVSIYITTLCRSDVYAAGCVIHTLWYIFEGINWKYKQVRTVWRGSFIIWNSWQCGKWWQIWWKFNFLIPTYCRVPCVGNTDIIQTVAAGQTGQTP